MVFQSRQKEIENGIDQYCHEVETCMQELRQALEAYLTHPDHEQLRNDLKQVHHAESQADDLRAKIEVLMYSKSVFPESREDILELLEMLDKIPNHAESCIRMVLTQNIVVPQEYTNEFLAMVGISQHAVTHTLDATRMLFHDYTNATVAVGKVDELESEVDHCEAKMIESIFQSDRDGFEKILLRDLIEHLGKISDRAENVGDRIRIIAAKRRT